VSATPSLPDRKQGIFLPPLSLISQIFLISTLWATVSFCFIIISSLSRVRGINLLQLIALEHFIKQTYSSWLFSSTLLPLLLPRLFFPPPPSVRASPYAFHLYLSAYYKETKENIFDMTTSRHIHQSKQTTSANKLMVYNKSYKLKSWYVDTAFTTCSCCLQVAEQIDAVRHSEALVLIWYFDFYYLSS